jgi:hypothetical protein
MISIRSRVPSPSPASPRDTSAMAVWNSRQFRVGLPSMSSDVTAGKSPNSVALR